MPTYLLYVGIFFLLAKVTIRRIPATELAYC